MQAGRCMGSAVHPKLRALPKSTLGAQAMTLDELGEIAGIKKVDFIKLDVDGYEGHVLRGGPRHVQARSPDHRARTVALYSCRTR